MIIPTARSANPGIDQTSSALAATILSGDTQRGRQTSLVYRLTRAGIRQDEMPGFPSR